MKIIFAKLNQLCIPYNYFVENAVDNTDYHMNIKIVPHPSVWGGLELSSGIFINSIPPEETAKIYNQSNDGSENTNF